MNTLLATTTFEIPACYWKIGNRIKKSHFYSNSGRASHIILPVVLNIWALLSQHLPKRIRIFSNHRRSNVVHSHTLWQPLKWVWPFRGHRQSNVIHSHAHGNCPRESEYSGTTGEVTCLALTPCGTCLRESEYSGTTGEVTWFTLTPCGNCPSESNYSGTTGKVTWFILILAATAQENQNIQGPQAK